MNFSITHDLISDVKASYSKYEVDRIARKALAEAQATQKRKEQEETAKSSLIASEVASINTEIEKCKSSLKGMADNRKIHMLAFSKQYR